MVGQQEHGIDRLVGGNQRLNVVAHGDHPVGVDDSGKVSAVEFGRRQQRVDLAPLHLAPSSGKPNLIFFPVKLFEHRVPGRLLQKYTLSYQ